VATCAEWPAQLRLNDLAGGQIFYQLPVGIEKIEAKELLTVAPLQVAEDAVLDFAVEFMDHVKSQFHGAAILVFMLNASDLVADCGVNTQFFVEFAAEGIAGLFSGFYFSTRKFPLERHGLVARALAHEDLAILHNQSSDNALHEWTETPAGTPATLGSTQLVKVKAKMASPVGQISSSEWVPKSELSTRAYMRALETGT
jgi:hypothetical protein